MALSVPRAKQSMRFAPQLTQSGASRMVPSRNSQPPHCWPEVAIVSSMKLRIVAFETRV